MIVLEVSTSMDQLSSWYFAKCGVLSSKSMFNKVCTQTGRASLLWCDACALRQHLWNDRQIGKSCKVQFLVTTWNLCHLYHPNSSDCSGITKEPPMIGTKIGIWVKLRCSLGAFWSEHWISLMVFKLSGPAFTKQVPWRFNVLWNQNSPVEFFQLLSLKIARSEAINSNSYKKHTERNGFLAKPELFVLWCHLEPNKIILPEKYTTSLD